MCFLKTTLLSPIKAPMASKLPLSRLLSEVMPSSCMEAANKEVKSVILESSEMMQQAQWHQQQQ